MLQSPPLASMLPFHHAMQVAAAQVRNNWTSFDMFKFVALNF